MHLLRNRFAWWDITRVICAFLLGAEALIGLISYLTVMKIILVPVLALLPIFIGFYIPFLVIGLASSDRLVCRFELNPDEIRFNLLPDNRPITRFARLAAPLAGGWRSLAPAIFHLHPDLIRLAWSEVYKLTFFPAEGVITISDSWRSVVRLYVPSTRYDAVCNYCEAHLAAVQTLRKTKQQRKPVSFYPVLTLVCVAAAFATQAWSWPDFDSTLKIGIIVALVAVLMVNTWMAWWCHLLAILSIVLSLWYLASLAMHAFSPVITSLHALVDFPGFVIAFLGGFFFLGLGIIRLTGKSVNPG
ncbi:MAG: hypothetical protein ACYC6L_12825 [Anaerolineae bacterium]